jgi:hypothetical protein
VVKPFDFDKDGDLDLFIGGRVVPGKYPTPSNSRLLENDGGTFKDVTEVMAPQFMSLGLVTDAEWADLENDGRVDLIVVGEWMPVSVFTYHPSGFEDRTGSLNLADQTGWWYSVTVEDLNDDNQQEIIAGNLGLNYKYKTSPEEPFQVYYHDFDANGTGDIVLGYFNDGELFPLRGRQCSSDQMPFIKKKFATYDAFGKANLREIYGADLNEAQHYVANTFATTIYHIGEQGYEPHPLPNYAQLSAVNGCLVSDYTGDGIKDLLIAGNLYPVEVETTRNDASIGLLLKGLEGGGFEPVGVRESGFFAPGDVKHLLRLNLANGEEGILVVRNNDQVSLLAVKGPIASPL